MASIVNKHYNFEWKIHTFTKEIVDDLKFAKCFLSNEFQIFLGDNETKWHFKLYVKDTGLSLYLQKTRADLDDFTVLFGVKCGKQEDTVNLDLCSKNKSVMYNFSRGWSNFLTSEMIFNNPEKYLKNNTLTLGLKVELVRDDEAKEPDSEIQSPEYDAILTKFGEYFETKTFCDFTFVCSDGVEIPAHRMILAMNSGVMKSKLDIDEVKATKANIKDIDGVTMTEVLRFLYTKKVNNIKELAPKLLYSAEKYELDNLKKFVVDSMVENLCIENALEYLILGEQYGIKYLQKSSAMFVKMNYKVICDKINDWNKLEVKHWTILMDYFRKNDNYIQIFESTLMRESLHNFSFDTFIRT